MEPDGNKIKSTLLDVQIMEILQELKLQAENPPKIDTTKLEIKGREIENEFFMRRNQVEQMRKELNDISIKNYELSAAVKCQETFKNEHQFNINLVLKQRRDFETKYNEESAALRKLEYLHKMTVSENETLKEISEKTGSENLALTRQVEELRSRLDVAETFQTEIVTKDAELERSLMINKRIMQELKQNQEKTMDFFERINMSVRSCQLLEFYKTKCEKLETENENIEKRLLEITAKYETLKNMISKLNPETLDQNLPAKFVALQWKKHVCCTAELLKSKNKIIDGLTDALKKEQLANMQLIQHIEEVKKHKLLKSDPESDEFTKIDLLNVEGISDYSEVTSNENVNLVSSESTLEAIANEITETTSNATTSNETTHMTNRNIGITFSETVEIIPNCNFDSISSDNTTLGAKGEPDNSGFKLPKNK